MAFDDRRPRRGDRARRPDFNGVAERLETRQLLANTPLNLTLPDLVVTGVAPPIAAYGQPITVTVDVQNLAATSQVEPVSPNGTTSALLPGAASSADAASTVVGVFLSRRPVLNTKAIELGTITVPYLSQNSAIELTQTFVMPNHPGGFPGSGGKVYLFFRADDASQIIQSDLTNDVSGPVPVTIEAALPDLTAIALDVPPVMQPGDTIAPSIKIANYGTANTLPQGPVTVFLVASTDKFFGPTDVVVGRYQISEIAPLSLVPLQNDVLGNVNLDDPVNVDTISTTTDGDENVQLPQGTSYFLGVVVDPFNTIRELSEVGRLPSPRLQLIQQVGPPIRHLPPAGVLSDPSPVANVFPFPAFSTTTTTTTTAQTLGTPQVMPSRIVANAGHAARHARHADRPRARQGQPNGRKSHTG